MFGEHRAGPERELAAAQRHRARDVGGQHVRRELQRAGTRRRARGRSRPRAASWPRPGTPSSSTWPPSASAVEHVLERLVVADDDLADLAGDARVQLPHAVLLLWSAPGRRRARRRTRSAAAGARRSASSGGPSRRPAAQRPARPGEQQAGEHPLDPRREAAEPARRAVAVHGLQERDRPVGRRRSASAERGASAWPSRAVLERRRVGEQRDRPAAAARADQQRRGPAGPSAGSARPSAVPAAAVAAHPVTPGRPARARAGCRARRRPGDGGAGSTASSQAAFSPPASSRPPPRTQAPIALASPGSTTSGSRTTSVSPGARAPVGDRHANLPHRMAGALEQRGVGGQPMRRGGVGGRAPARAARAGARRRAAAAARTR